MAGPRRPTVPSWLRLGGAGVVLALVALAAPARAAAPPSAPPGVGIRLVDAPVAREGDPRARVYIVDRVRPGAEFSRRVEVSNGDPTTASFELYATSASINSGAFTLGAQGDPSPVTSWFTVSPSRITLPPGGHTQALVTVHVPADAPPGEVYGGVVAERPAPTTTTGVGVALRVAIRVYLSVGPGGEPASDFVVDSLQAVRGQDGRPRVLAQVRNTGGRALDMRGSLRLTGGPGGLSAGPYPAVLGTTLGLGQTEPVTVVLASAIAGGPWTATLDVSSGQLTRRATAVISFPGAAGAASPPVTAKQVSLYKDKKVVVPIAAGLVGLLSLVLLVIGYLTSRHRARGRAAR